MAEPPHSKEASGARPGAQGERGQRGRQEPGPDLTGHLRTEGCHAAGDPERCPQGGRWRNSEAGEERLQRCGHATRWLRQVVVGRRKVRVVWGPALNVEVTMSADGLDVGERERTGQ